MQQLQRQTNSAADRNAFEERLAIFTKAQAPAKAAELVGYIKLVKMFGPEWGFAILVPEGGQEVKLTGRVGDLKEWAEYSVTGQYKTHPLHGQSFEVLGAKPHVQLNTAALVKFIKNNYKGIGEVSAKKFVSSIEAAGGMTGLSELRNKLLNEPWNVDFGAIKREGTFEGEGDEVDKTIHAFIQRDLAIRVGSLSSNVLSSLAYYLVGQLKLLAMVEVDASIPLLSAGPVEKSWAVLKGNPYAPISSVPRYGFLSADVIGRIAKIPPEAPVRVAALVDHAVKEYCTTYGHVYLTREQACQGIAKVDKFVNPMKALDQALRDGIVDVDDEFGQERIYPAKLRKAEEKLAKKIAGMCFMNEPLVRPEKGVNLRDKVQYAAKMLGGAFKDGLDESQLAALTGILTSKSRIHTITADPGAGKTAVMEVLTRVLKGKKFLFCAPTGQSAKVLSNRVSNAGLFASTIHSMLQADPDGSFAYDEGRKLEADVLVVDEGSFPDLRLASAVFDAVDDDMHVIVLGDDDQLPSIEPGRVLSDFLKIEQIDHHKLTIPHRNSAGILEFIRDVKKGRVNPKNRPDLKFSGSLPSASTGFNAVMAEYLVAVERSGYEGTALLMSRRQGDINEPGWNTTYANEVLRAKCNPGARKLPGSTLCVNDRIVIKANMSIVQGGSEPKGIESASDKRDDFVERVVNGDKGTIVSYSTNPDDHRNSGVHEVRLKLDDGRTVDFPGSALQSVQLAYATTVHASQGSEYKDVIAVITPGRDTFINRNMLITCISRARTHLSVHANDIDLLKIAATPMPLRNSGLVERIQREIETFAEDENNRNSNASHPRHVA